MQRFIPAFFQNIDKALLINSPDVWATRIHHLLFWGGCYALCAYLLASIYPITTYNVPITFDIMLYSLIPSAIILLFWAYNLSLYKVSTQFGEISKSFSIKEVGIYLLGISLLMGTAFGVGKTFENRIGHLVPKDTFHQDVKIFKEFSSTGITPINLLSSIEIYNRYSDVPILKSSEEFSQDIQLKTDYYKSYFYIGRIISMEANIRRIKEAQSKNTWLYSPDFYKISLFSLVILCLSLLIFLRIGLRDFLILLVSGYILLSGSILMLEYTEVNTNVCASLFFVEWIGGILLLTLLKQSPLMKLIKRLVLSMIVLASPFLFYAWQCLSTNSGRMLLNPCLLCAGITLLAWVVIYDRQMLKIYAKPNMV